VIDAGSGSVGPAAAVDMALHTRPAGLLKQYDVIDFAAGVKGFVVKPI
jgi:hypothetical protein